jgi:hypothetical protein
VRYKLNRRFLYPPRRFYRPLAGVLLGISLCVLYTPVCAQEEQERTAPPPEEPLEDEEKNLYGALLEGQIGNIIGHFAFRFISDPMTGMHIGASTAQSIHDNLSGDWHWDEDIPFPNQLGHPYHGSYSHLAARINGFSFYEGFFFNALASAAWEIAGETSGPSLNDLITTTIGGAVVGEMLHRLYLEIDSPLKALLNPVGAFDSLIRGKPLRGRAREGYGAVSYVSALAGASFLAANDKLALNNKTDGMPRTTFLANFGFDLVYGDPFVHQSKIPFSQFEFKLRAGGPSVSRTIQNWFNITLLSGGYLFASNLLNTERNKLSAGLSMEYDVLGMGVIDSYQNALNWTLKWRRRNENTVFVVKAGAGWTMFASSYYFNPGIRPGWAGVPAMAEYDNSYGTGANVKLHFSAAFPRAGELSVDAVSLVYYAIPYVRPAGGGFESLGMVLTEYSFPVAKGLSLVLADTFFVRRGVFFQYSNDFKAANEVSLSLRRTFINHRVTDF